MTSKPTISPQDRIEGLRNLHKGYESVVSAVGFWEELHGEDLIEEYASLYEQLVAAERSLEEQLTTAQARIEELEQREHDRRMDAMEASERG